MLTSLLALSALYPALVQDLVKPEPPSRYNDARVLRDYLNSVHRWEVAQKKTGFFTEEDEEWAEEQFEFLGMRAHLLMMRGGKDGQIDQSLYREGIKHRAEMRQLSTDYIGVNWNFVGPRALDGSTSCQLGPVAGRVNAVCYNPADPNDWWVGGATGGVFKTADNGASFANESDTWDTTYSSAIAVDPNNQNRVYVATGDYPGWWGYGLGIMRTSDGTSWTNELVTELDGCEVSDIMVDPDDSSTILVTAGRGSGSSDGVGIWRSGDYGNTWTRVQSTTTSNGYTTLSAGVSSAGVRNIYAGGGDSGLIKRSQDGGLTWTFVNLPTFNFCAVAASKTNRDTVYAYDSGGNIYMSTNAGGAWTSIRGNLGNITAAGADFRQVGYNYMFDVINSSADGSGSDILLFGAVDLFALINPRGGNTTWTWINGDPGQTRIVHADYHGFSQHPTLKNAALIANDGGVWFLLYVANTFVWTNKSSALRLTEHVFTAAHPDASNFPNYVVTGMWHIGCGFSPNDVNDWRSVHGGDGMWTAIDNTNPLIQFTSDQRGEDTNTIDLRATVNGWASSSSYSTSTSIANEDFAFASPWVEVPGETGALYLAGERLYKFKVSAAGTGTWTKSIGNADFSNTAGEYVTAIEAVSGGGCFTGTNSGRLYGSLNATTGVPFIVDLGTAVSSICASPTDTDDLLVTLGGVDRGPGFPGALWEVLDATGSNPTVVDRSGNGANSLPNVGANWVERDPYDPMFTWYVATDLGVYYTRDRGQNWYNISETFGLPNAMVYQLEVSDNYLYASTFGRGIWRMTLFSAAPTLTAFTFQNAEVTGGNKARASMTLSREAPPGGLDIPVTSNNLAAVPTQLVHFPGGFTTAFVDVDTNVVTADSTVTVTGNYGGPVSDSIIVRECVVNDLILTDLTSGDSTLAGVSINRAAPTGGLVVNFADNDAGTTVTPSVTINEGQTIGFFVISTSLWPTDKVVSVQASGPGSGWQESFTKFGVRITSVGMTKDPVWNTRPSGIQISLNRAAPVSGFPVTIVSGVPNAATAPATFTVPGGDTSGVVPVTTFYVPTDTTAGFRVTDPYQGFVEPTLLVKHLGVSSISLVPNPAVGGANLVGTVQLDRRADEPITLLLGTDRTDLVGLPSTVTIPTNQGQATFPATTSVVNSAQSATVATQLGNQAVTGAYAETLLKLLPTNLVVVPTSYTINLGQLNAGSVASLAADDGNVLRICKFIVPNQTVAPITVQLDGTSQALTATSMKLEFKNRMQTAGLFSVTLDLWNWGTNNWDATNVLTAGVNTTFSTQTLNVTGALSQFLRSSDGAVRARYRIRQTGPSTGTIWCHETDRANWILTP